MKVTNKQIEVFQLNAEAWLNKEQGKESKFLFALRKVRKKNKKLYEDFQEKVQELRIEYASVDGNGNILMTGDRIEYKPEKLKELQSKIKEEKKKEFEIEPHYAIAPKDLPVAFKDVFINFVIEDKEEVEPEDIEQKEEAKSN